MRKIYFVLFGAIITLASCQKNISDFSPSTRAAGTLPDGSFAAIINGNQVNFTVISATLVRSTATNEKRMDIAGISTDSTKKIILTLGEETSQGNAITAKNYVLNAFPPDDPSTPNIDESLYPQGFTTYGILVAGNWVFDFYDENGSCTVTSCNPSTTLISGTFQTTLTDIFDSTHVVKMTTGTVTNVKYSVLN